MKQILMPLLCLLVATSCTDSFFELEPNTEVTTSKVYKTDADFNIAVVGAYAKLQSQVNFYLEMCEYRSDNMTLSAPTTGTQDRYDIDKFSDRAANGILDDYWANFNNGVYRCNLILDKIDAATFDEAKRNQYKAEAMFLRALTYFNMYRAWGGVTVARRVLTPTEALQVVRSSDEQMFDYIAGDLKVIIDEQMLPMQYSSSDIGRATLGAAKALLSKVYLTFGKYQEAADLLSTIIGEYSLQAEPQMVFDVNNKNNSEIIFAVRFNKSIEGEGHGFWYAISNLTDESGQSEELKNLYSPEDKRKALIEYVKVPGVNTYLMRKFYDEPDAVFTTRTGNDQILIRYADVLLMYAEALNELSFDPSSGSAAVEALNAVRLRAGLDALTQAELSSKEAFRRAISVERHKEFPYEGQRWFDLVRMGYAKEVILAQEGISVQDYQLVYPIPTSEMERINNASILWQNPGY